MNILKIIHTNLVYKYFDLYSRTSCRDFWISIAILAICAVALLALFISDISPALISTWALMIFIPSQTLAMRRFMDVGLSKGDYFIFMFIISFCIILAYFLQRNGYVFSTAVMLWFLLGNCVVLCIQFCRTSTKDEIDIETSQPLSHLNWEANEVRLNEESYPVTYRK